MEELLDKLLDVLGIQGKSMDEFPNRRKIIDCIPEGIYTKFLKEFHRKIVKK